MLNLTVQPGALLQGKIQVPGDKSISHRAIMFASIASGTSQIHGCLMGADNRATINVFRQLGVEIHELSAGYIEVLGRGTDSLIKSDAPLDLGNSGTAIRLLMGLLVATGVEAELLGDESLNSRPMERIATPLRERGATIGTAVNGTPPVVLSSAQNLTAYEFTLPIDSAQLKSAVLLSGLFCGHHTKIIEPRPTRDHTERMLQVFGYPVDSQDTPEGKLIEISGTGKLTATRVEVPGDYSSAAFFIVAGLLTKRGQITLSKVGCNPTRNGIIPLLQMMGGDIEIIGSNEGAIEPVVDIVVTASHLKGIEVPESYISLAIDELPVLCIAAASAEGQTVIRGAKELRVKESDRIHAVTQMLLKLGVEVEELEDGWIVQGNQNTFKPTGGDIDSFDDHRIAMSAVIASLRADSPLTVRNCDNIETSFPGFVDLCTSLGMHITSSH